jgi:hypothetical protein
MAWKTPDDAKMQHTDPSLEELSSLSKDHRNLGEQQEIKG